MQRLEDEDEREGEKGGDRDERAWTFLGRSCAIDVDLTCDVCQKAKLQTKARLATLEAQRQSAGEKEHMGKTARRPEKRLNHFFPAFDTHDGRRNVYTRASRHHRTPKSTPKSTRPPHWRVVGLNLQQQPTPKPPTNTHANPTYYTPVGFVAGSLFGSLGHLHCSRLAARRMLLLLLRGRRRLHLFKLGLHVERNLVHLDLVCVTPRPQPLRG